MSQGGGSCVHLSGCVGGRREVGVGVSKSKPSGRRCGRKREDRIKNGVRDETRGGGFLEMSGAYRKQTRCRHGNR